MSYTYKGQTSLQIAEKFIDSFIERKPAELLGKSTVSNYIQGVFIAGLEKVYLENRKPEYKKYLDTYFDLVLDEDKKLNRIEGDYWCSLNSLDFRQIGNLLFRYYDETGDKRYLESIGELVETLETDYPVNSYGGYWHMKSTPNQMWLDGLFMAGPLCAKYSVLSGKKEFGASAIHQACLMYENMRDKKDNLLYHGWDDTFEAQWADKETGLSPNKWGRALGWFTVATVDILEALGTDYEGADVLLGYVKEIFEALSKVQRQNGMCCQVIDMPEKDDNWGESSCTALISYSMAKAVRLGFIDEKYLENAKKGYNSLIEAIEIRENGEYVLTKICTGTCIEEGTYEFYINRPRVENDMHGSGAFLHVCAEMNKVNS